VWSWGDEASQVFGDVLVDLDCGGSGVAAEAEVHQHFCDLADCHIATQHVGHRLDVACIGHAASMALCGGAVNRRSIDFDVFWIVLVGGRIGRHV